MWTTTQREGHIPGSVSSSATKRTHFLHVRATTAKMTELEKRVCRPIESRRTPKAVEADVLRSFADRCDLYMLAVSDRSAGEET